MSGVDGKTVGVGVWMVEWCFVVCLFCYDVLDGRHWFKYCLFSCRRIPPS